MYKLALHWQILIAMALGASIGLALNMSASRFEASSDPNEARAWSIRDSTDVTTVDIRQDGLTTTYRVDGHYIPGTHVDDKLTDADGGVTFFLVTVDELEDRFPEIYDLFYREGRSWARWAADVGQALGSLFLQLLKMVTVPLIITSLITGVTSLGHAQRLGRMFGRTVLYYVSTSMLAIVTGLALVNLIQPGNRGVALAAAAVSDAGGGKSLPTVLWEQLLNLMPANPIQAAAEGNFLSIISFSLIFGMFAVVVGGKTLETISGLIQAGFEVMMRLTLAIIKLAPWGVLFMMLSATAAQGLGVFQSLGLYMLTVALALAFHAGVTLPLILKFVARRNPIEFAKAMSPALLTAFSSSSSNATLPLTLTSVEQRAGVSNRVSSFLLPLGATVNMDGTALYEAVAVLFIAQWSLPVQLTLAQQVVVALTALLASIGAAGIPQAGLVMMVIILQAVNLPTESTALIIAVDRLLDMFRTAVNVWSDSCGCAVVARFDVEEGPPTSAEPAAGVADHP